MNKNLLMDKRIVDRNIQRGLVSQDDYRSHIQALPDASENMEYVSIDSKEEEEAAKTDAGAESAPSAEAGSPDGGSWAAGGHGAGSTPAASPNSSPSVPGQDGAGASPAGRSNPYGTPES